MGSGFHDDPIVDDGDDVSVLDGGQPVRDHDGGPPQPRLVQGLLHDLRGGLEVIACKVYEKV